MMHLAVHGKYNVAILNKRPKSNRVIDYSGMELVRGFNYLHK